MELKYTFYIVVERSNGGHEYVEWTRLSLSDAKKLYKLTCGHCREGIVEYGWKEQEQ